MAKGRETRRVVGAPETSNGPLQALKRQRNFFQGGLARNWLSPISASSTV